MTVATPAASTETKLSRALLRFRVMAFVTGFVLLAGTIAVICKDVLDFQHMEPGTGILWVFHGYLFLVYVATVLNLGIKRRWPIVRTLLIMVCGTIPTMSFVAEHLVTKKVREQTW